MISKSYIMSKSNSMVDEHEPLNKMYRAMDRFTRNDWELPREMRNKQWAYKSVDTSPHNALNTATKVLSAETPRITVLPAGPDPEDKDTANKIERGLGWELMKADRRARSRIVPDIVRSALRYDRVCVQVIHLPHHYDSIKASIDDLDMEDDEKTDMLNELQATRRAALRLGNYAISLRNPQNVYSRTGEMGLESILLVQKMTAKDIYDVWGNRAKFLINEEDPRWEEKEWNFCDYSDHSVRMVWCSPHEATNLTNEEGVILYGKHGLPFIPWIDVFGGTSLDSEIEYQCKPFLESIYRSKSWDATNVIRTLSVSEVIKYAAAARAVTRTATGSGIPIQYGGDQASINLKPGDEYTQLPPQQIDRALLEWFDRYKNELNAQTSVQVLADLNFPAGTAYATINAVLQTAIASLQPYKLLAQRALEEIFELMLLWIDFTGVPIESFGTSRDNAGTHYNISKEDFSTNAIYITVDLNASAPTDRTEKINAGVMLYKNLPVDAESVLTEIGFADPQKVMRDRSYENMVDNEAQIVIRQRQQEAEMQLQQMLLPIQLQMQQMAQMQQMQMQQMAQMQASGGMGMGGPGPNEVGGPPTGVAGVPPGPQGADLEAFAAAQGPGYDQANGGISTNQLAPGMTKERITGYDARGEAIAEAR